jgi:glycosyltransferase involved in cell wall biosynthesis
LIVGIDGKPLLMQKTGIGIYADRLLASVCGLDNNLGFRVYLPFSLTQLGREAKGYRKSLTRQHPERVEFISSSFPPKLRRWIWQNSRLMPIERIIGEIDLFHATNLVMPPLRKAKGILTLYDLTFMLLPSYHVKGMHSFVEEVKRSAGRADGLIAISEHTKRDVMEFLNIPEERIRVTLLAADEQFRVIKEPDAIQSVVSRYGIDREYILYTGTLEPRKNIVTLVQAFHDLKRDSGIPHRLVLAGKKGWLFDDIFSAVEKLDLVDDVIFTGYVPDGDLPYLYNGASLFAYPSRYEGFGLPPLEAMACGCPVVTSNTSSLPEVVGDAGIMVDPEHSDDLADAMQKVLSDSSLRDSLRSKGLARAATFSWNRCARETLEIYHQVTGTN